MRRDSIEAGTFEDAFFSRPSKGETDRIYKRAAALSAGRANLRARIAHEEREPTPREAAILRFSRNTLAVLEALLRIARVQAGRVYPTLEYLAETVGIGRRTVIRALALLTELGFVLAQRRFKRVEIDGVGPRYKQTSNAYRMLMPAWIEAHLPRWLRPAPLPADVVQQEAERIEQTAAMLSSLSRREYALATVDGQLGKVLARLGSAIDAKESECQPGLQPLLDSYIISSERLGLAGQGVHA
ncbi:helix-turn-helix domain-containing protein [Sphingobium sp.]|uniref:helix-turn-helix domain-containing protein n=1 Tax=Sphingobium sp. TaxID=1912891 RepID=UPI00257EA4BC|nr:helix-turn-helix domain-containing protein [Sphingobium sp.]